MSSPSKSTPNENDVAALLTFLSDTSEQTVALAKDHLKQILRQNPSYRNLLENPSDPAVASHARIFLEETRLEELKDAFRELAVQGKELDLEQGAILLAQFAYPALDAQIIPRMLDRMAAEIEKELDAQETSSSREVMILRRYLFDRQGFMGNERNYYDPDNSFLHKVLENKMGIPISLSCVYLFLAKRLDLPAYGVGLPGHFIVGHKATPGVIYIDPFNRGKRSHQGGLRRGGSPARHDIPGSVFSAHAEPSDLDAHDRQPRQCLYRTATYRTGAMADANPGAV